MLVGIIYFNPFNTGKYHVRATLVASSVNVPSMISLVFLKKNGWTIPFKNLDDAADSLEDTVHQLQRSLVPKSLKGLELRAATNQICVFGGVLRQGGWSGIVNSSLGNGERIVVASGDSLTRKLSLTLSGKLGTVLLQSQDKGIAPSLRFRSAGDGYGIRLDNLSSQGPSVTMVGILEAW